MPVSVLRAVGGALVDIHGQGSHLSLLDPRFQLRALDDSGGLAEQRNAVQQAVEETLRLRGEVAEVDAAIGAAEQRRDLLAFQVDEIEASAPVDGEEGGRCCASGTCWSTPRACATPAPPPTTR